MFALHPKTKPAGWRSGKRRCYWCRQGHIQKGGCIPPSAIFKLVFDEYSFSIISHNFARIIENVQTNLSTTVCKFSKTVYEFSKIFLGSMPPDLLELFLFSICFKMILPEKHTLKSKAEFGTLL